MIKIWLNKSIALIVLGSPMLFINMTATATTLEELQQVDKVRINSWVEPQDGIIARQQVKLQIEVATDTRFSGGAKIGHFEIKDAIVLQREKFAVNSTRTDGDKDWTVQQWTLVVYPLRSGSFEIPAIPITLSIAGENLESITGKINTNPLVFSAKQPEALRGKKGWVATTRFDVEDSFDKPIEELKPGDALIRIIHMSADDLPAMMLPKFDAEDISGIAIYQKPPQVSDKVNRGDYFAERIETLTYVLEKPGEYLLPARSYYWWNLESGSLETIELPAKLLRVTSSSHAVDLADENQDKSVQDKSIDGDNLPSKLGVALVILGAAWLIWRRLRFYIQATPAKSAELSEKVLQRKFEKACRDNDFEKAMQLLYQWLDTYGGDSFYGSIRRRLHELGQAQTMNEFNKIMRSIYSADDNNEIDLRQFANRLISELKQKGQSSWLRNRDIELKLN